MNCKVVTGDLIDQPVDVIVNAWNRNVIPWWLLLPQGVSGTIKRHGGTGIFKELARYGAIPLGEARLTGPGRLNFKAIIHVAGINLFWTATEYSVRKSVRSSIELACANGFSSMAMPLIGSGSGSRSRRWSKAVIVDELDKLAFDIEVLVVEFIR